MEKRENKQMKVEFYLYIPRLGEYPETVKLLLNKTEYFL